MKILWNTKSEIFEILFFDLERGDVNDKKKWAKHIREGAVHWANAIKCNLSLKENNWTGNRDGVISS